MDSFGDHWRKALGQDAPGSLASRARMRRWDLFRRCFPQVAQFRVLDLGGTSEWWQNAPVRPASVVVVNLDPQESSQSWISCVRADACDPPSSTTGQDFDLVFSNSLIEHVGGHARRQQLAGVIRRSAPRHWVQTPYRYFPLEPHWLFPGFQFFPVRARTAISQLWPGSNITSPGRSRIEATANALAVELVSKTEMRFYFPGSEIVSEHFAGLVKSLIAISR